MPNLKDIRTRINSVITTRQVTSAMKMVSAAKLKKSQDNISHIRPFTIRLAGIIHDLNFSLEEDISCIYTDENKSEKVMILAIASNRGLCGAFNSNIVKTITTMINSDLQEEFKKGNVVVGVLGKQVAKLLKIKNITPEFEYNDLAQASTYKQTKTLSQKLIDGFTKGEYKKVLFVYNEFINAAVQNVQTHQYLPFSIPKIGQASRQSMQYLLEPDINGIIYSLIPEMLHAMLYQVVLESQASEHGARMTSMHKATDNATELINDLQLSYNKARQSAITNEILEVTGGAEALNG
ncbi:MAG: ATP synthase F1 subunit gamma [Marinilabiliaceae bacterium]|nr:ATP synthase F1 subunit gamma [Marinilabiliaceae bacterium]